MDIGENIKKIRKLKNISQEKLSELSGIPRTSLGRYERNERTLNIDILKKIAIGLNINFQELVTGQLIEIKTYEKDITKFSTEEILRELERRIQQIEKDGIENE